jgi:hypothetical protein
MSKFIVLNTLILIATALIAQSNESFAQSTARAEAQCVDGRWEISISGNCVEQYVDCVGTVPAQPATGANTLIRNYSRCPADKDACFWDIKDEPGGTEKEEVKQNDPSNQTDTMFSILPGNGADGFIERNRSYKGSEIAWNNVKAEPEKLLWITRTGSANDENLRMMIPTKEADYQQFLKAAKKDGLIETDVACMPIEIRLCSGVTSPTARPCPAP